jgi:archaellum component FlaF (FlaF/FlaG flagellin family)
MENLSLPIDYFSIIIIIIAVIISVFYSYSILSSIFYDIQEDETKRRKVLYQQGMDYYYFY